MSSTSRNKRQRKVARRPEVHGAQQSPCAHPLGHFIQALEGEQAFGEALFEGGEGFGAGGHAD